MPLLVWDKLPKKMPVEDWKTISADGAPPGVYSPNLSREDAQKWRAKLCGHKSGHPQVEIRTSKGGCQLLIIVSVQGNIKYQGRIEECNVRISSNGPVQFRFEDFEEMKVAVAEAAVKLHELE